MKLRHLTTSVLALAMAATPVLAQAAPERASAPVTEESEMAGRPRLLWILAAIAIGVGIYFLFIDDNDDPDSP